MNTRDIWLRLRAIIRPRAVDRELDDELSFHLEMATRKNLAAGLQDSEARRRARVRFGPKALIEDQCRDARGIGFLDTLRQDVRYALRSFRRSPTFAATIVATIALGLGANAAVFTLFNVYVLRPLDVRDPYSLYGFTWRARTGRFHSFSRAEYDQFKRENQVFSETFASRKQLIARIDGRPAYGKLVTEEYFRVLGVETALGRTLMPEDEREAGREAVIVLSHAFWMNHFGADPQIIGKAILIRGWPCEVVGVLREGFAGLDVLPHDFWAPLALAPQIDAGSARLEIIGRLRPDVSVTSAKAALAAWAQAMTADRPEDERAMSILFESRATSVPRSPVTLTLFSPMLLAFALVMVIACANVANMMLARAMARQREIGIRLSLGAARARVVRQLLTESLMLAAPAAVAAFVISQWTVDFSVRALVAAMPAEYAAYVRLLSSFPADLRVCAFMVLASVASAVLFGAAPALEATRPNLMHAARGDFMYDLRPARPRNGLVVIQIAVSACLLISAVVLLRSANRFANLDTGLRTRDVVEIGIREQSRPRVLEVLESMALGPVGAVSSVPLDAAAPRVAVADAESPVIVNAGYRFAAPEFFAVFDIPLVGGRHFTELESVSRLPLAIVSQTAARRLWPNRDPIGQLLRIHTGASTTDSRSALHRYSTVEVIGIARDIATGYLDNESDRTAIYLPASARHAGTVLIVRVPGNVEAARRELDEKLTAASPGAIDRIHTMHALAVGRVFPLRIAYWISGGIGILALILTISGVYGLLSYIVTQRAKEIGIRMALGATIRTVTGLVLRQSLRLALIGLFIGGAMAAGASTLFRKQLMLAGSFDGVAYVCGILIVLASCMLAACVPATRAARVDPVNTVRHD